MRYSTFPGSLCRQLDYNHWICFKYSIKYFLPSAICRDCVLVRFIKRSTYLFVQLCFIRIENNWRVFQRDEIFAVLDSENLILQVVISASLPDWPETKINTLPLINVKATHVNAHPDILFLSISFGLNILPCYSLRGRWIEFLSLCVICYLLSYITTRYGPLSLDLINFFNFRADESGLRR